MFTGIVTAIGTVEAVTPRADGLKRLRIANGWDPEGIAMGASICHNGICMTVVDKGGQAGASWYDIDAAAETLAVTTAGGWVEGAKLNLERSLKIGDELGGHIVTGHVDGVATVIARDDFDGMARFRFDVPAPLARFIAPKGSVALDGTSLTVNEVAGTTFTILLIPHTLDVTTWGAVKVGDRINIEVDLMARYAARLAETAPR
jgi:riboflavin synthase